MIVLFTALTLAAAQAPPPQPAATLLTPQPVRFRGCSYNVTKVGQNQKVEFHKLGDLPDAHEEIAVNRTVSGCPAPMIVRYNVSRR